MQKVWLFLLLSFFVFGVIALTSPVERRQQLASLLYTLPFFSHSCCQISDISDTGDFDASEEVAIFNNKLVNYPKDYLADLGNKSLSILGTTTEVKNEEKWIEVSLKEQKLRAWEGGKLFLEVPISSGKWGLTPKGEYRIWYKTRRQKMSGGSRLLGTYYYLPNVPHNMFFYQGYAIHGAYWHNNFGQPMSHGCVNTPLKAAAILFEWTTPVVPPGQNVARATPDNPGTKVIIY